MSKIRTMWRLISAVQQHYAVLLTTHSMIEADVLCGRVAILREGRLIELDSPIALKQKHSKFMTLTVTKNKMIFFNNNNDNKGTICIVGSDSIDTRIFEKGFFLFAIFLKVKRKEKKI